MNLWVNMGSLAGQSSGNNRSDRQDTIAKTGHMQKTIIAFFFIVLTACRSDPPSPGKNSLTTASTSPTAPSSTVKIIRNGQTVAEYSSRAPNAVIDAEVLMIELNSPDTRYSFMGYINGTTTGNYPLTATREKGKAAISIYNDGIGVPASINPEKGELIITRMNGKSCSGSFSGSLKHSDGKEIAVTGSFSNIPVRSIDAQQ